MDEHHVCIVLKWKTVSQSKLYSGPLSMAIPYQWEQWQILEKIRNKNYGKMWHLI